MAYTKNRQYLEIILTDVERQALKKAAIDADVQLREYVSWIIRQHLFKSFELPPRTSKTRRAHSAVLRAIKAGQLAKLDGSIKCTDCEQPATEYDHRDYNKPLEVQPVCQACNKKRGPGNNRLDKPDKQLHNS